MIKIVVVINITVLSKTELDVARFEYCEIVNSSEILNGIDAIDYVWNQSDYETCPDKKCVKSNKGFLTDDDIRLMVSSNSSN